MEFLQFKVEQKVQELTPSPSLSPSQAKTNLIVSFDRSSLCEEVLLVMQQALEEYPAPSLQELAFRIGCQSCDTLYTYSNSLSTAICDRHAFYRQLDKRERIRSLLQNVLNSNESPPPSVRKVTRRYHVSLATCYRYATDLCQAISLRYKDYRKLQQKQAIEQGISEVRRLAPELYAQGINPTVKKIRRFMTHPETLWYPEVVEALTEVRCSLKD